MKIIENTSYNAEKLHDKLKINRVRGLAKEVLGKSFDVADLMGKVFIREKINFFESLFSRNHPLLFSITLKNDFFRIYDKKYFNRAEELAKRYEEYFGKKVTIETAYSIN